MLPADTARSAILGSPLNPGKQPSPSGVVRAFEQMDARILANSSGALVVDTYSDLSGLSSPAANIMVWVMSGSQAGVYQNTGTSGSPEWTKRADLPYGVIKAINVGAGTANAIVATSAIPVPSADGAALIILPIVAANDASPVTVAFNGGSALTIKSNTGNDIAIGGLQAGMLVLGFKSGSTFRIVTNQVSSAIIAQAEAYALAAANSAGAAEAAAASAEAARDAALSAVPNAFPEDRTALKALNTSTITAAYLKEAGREGQWLWDATVPVATHQADTDENRYAAPDPEEDGAWVRAGSVPTGEFFGANGARIARISDRLMVGDSVAYDGTIGAGAKGSWLTEQGAGSSKMGWIERNAGLSSVVSDGAIGVTGAARNVGADGSVIGILGFAVNKGTVDQTAWGSYFEAVREPGGGSAWAVEIDTTNLEPSPAGVLPYSPYGARGVTYKGTTIGIGIQAGGDPAVNPVVYDCDVAISVGSNGAKWLSGLVFLHSALYREGETPTGRAHAISMAPNHAIDWYGDSSHQEIAAYITSTIADNANRSALEFNSAGLLFRGRNDGIIFQIENMASVANYLVARPSQTGGALTIYAAGQDTNISSVVRPKGSGEFQVQSGDATAKVRVSNTGLGFFGNAPVARPTGVAVDAASIHAALVTLGLIAA